MFAKALVTLLLLPALATAQDYGGSSDTTTPASSASSTSSALAVVPTAPANTAGRMNINVAFNKKLVFNPPNITAPVGTLVTFYYPNYGLNHSVTQSTFDKPCTYLAANSSSNTSAGFDSSLLSASTFTINITDPNPIWFFCKQVLHCGQGMVGSINAPPTGNTYANFLAAAVAIGANEVTTPDNGPVVAGVGATAIGSPVPDATGSATSSATGSTSTGSSSSALKVTTSIGFTLIAAVLGVAMA